MAYHAAQERTRKMFQEELAKERARLNEIQETIKRNQALLKEVQKNVAYFEGLIAFLSRDQAEPEPVEVSSDNSLRADQSLAAQSHTDDNGESDGGQLALSGAYQHIDLDFDDDSFEEYHLIGQEEENNHDSVEGSPMDWLRDEYQGKSLSDVIQIILDSSAKSYRAVEIAKIAYSVPPENKKDFARARNSISAQLRLGAEEGRWKKIGRGRFSSHLTSMNNSEALS